MSLPAPEGGGDDVASGVLAVLLGAVPVAVLVVPSAWEVAEALAEPLAAEGMVRLVYPGASDMTQRSLMAGEMGGQSVDELGRRGGSGAHSRWHTGRS